MSKTKSLIPNHSLLRTFFIRLVGRIKFGNRPKIFGIGFNKTGTTSLSTALKSLGYTVAFQGLAEKTFPDWKQRDFQSLIQYCRYGGNAFQDIPFSAPYTFQAMDLAFPSSKFILTVRDTPEQWYNSVISFQSKLFGNGNLPTIQDLKKASYGYKGFAYESVSAKYGTKDTDLYNKDVLIKSYLSHMEIVTDYFSHRPNDLLILNVSEDNAMEKLCSFLDQPYIGQVFPRENQTKNL